MNTQKEAFLKFQNVNVLTTTYITVNISAILGWEFKMLKVM